MTCFRIQCVALVAVLCFASAHCTSTCSAQLPGEDIQLGTIDAKTRWAFRSISPVTLTSPIIRLGDIVQPLDPHMAGWQRLRRSPVGLVPIGGQTMTIQRDRLAQAIHDAEATPLAIDWLGPEKIKVIYQPQRSGASMSHSPRARAHGTVVAAAYEAESTATHEQLTSAEAERIVHWIRLALEQQIPSVAETYDLKIQRDQIGLPQLRSISGVTTITLSDKAGDGPRRFHVVARSITGPIEADVEVILAAHPRVVVPRKSFSRGHLISAGDLTMKPLPEIEMEADYVTDPDAVIGMEVRSTVRGNRPMRHGDLGSPILVHRGDLIEVRVVSGGITITTNAKSIGNGAVSDLIEIETLQPRRRLVARVVQPGTVEIVTRAPRVNP